MSTVSDVIRIVDEFAPPFLAMDWDKIGLQVGRMDKPVQKVLVTLDMVTSVIDEAISIGADLIVSHHPYIYNPITAVRTDNVSGQDLQKLLQHDISVYVAHTNLDIAEGGINDVLAKALGLYDIEILDRLHNQRLRKLVVFVPETHHEQVMDALCKAGAGWIGNYSHCTFNTQGTGTFMPQDGTHPYMGSAGVLERVQEVRLETIVPEEKQQVVIEAMLLAHPYEEVAYDLYPLEIMGRPYGIGRIGRLDAEMTLADFSQHVKISLQAKGVRVVGEFDKKIRRVAVLGGAGADWIKQAAEKGADVLVTADLKYHDGHDAGAFGLALVDAGHYATEKIATRNLADRLHERLLNEGNQIEVAVSQVDTDPFEFV